MFYRTYMGINAFFYADDYAFVMLTDDVEEAVVLGWCLTNRLTLNRAKTQKILFDQSSHSPVSVNYLGLMIDGVRVLEPPLPGSLQEHLHLDR